MNNNILQYYAYLVCFVMVSCGAIYSGIMLYDIVEVAAPEFTLSEKDKVKYYSNSNFIDHNYIYPDGKAISKYEGFSDEEITRLRKNEYQFKILNEKNNAIKSIVQSIIILIITALLFSLHWRIAKNAREQ